MSWSLIARLASLSAVAVLSVATAFVPAQPVLDTNLDGVDAGVVSGTTGDVDAVLDDQQTADATAMPDNPAHELPETLNDDIPDDASVVSPDLAVTVEGEVLDLVTGEPVSDAAVVGTPETPADPLAKTDGESFVPVGVSEVRGAMDAVGVDAGAGSGAGASSSSDAVGVVRPAALQDNQYGAHWGTYNGTPAFFEADGTLFVQQAKGVVDVSQWQGRIDWQKAKDAGVEGAIIRISYGWGNGFDAQALRNISECKRLGIPFGVYSYSYAYDDATAAAEGSDIVALLRQAGVAPGDLSYPVFYDLERWTWTGHTPPTSPDVYNGIVATWYGKLQAAGYSDLSVYSYTSYLNGPLNHSSIRGKTRWVASYGSRTNFPFAANDRGWQYTSSGSVAGINGNVDLNAFGDGTFVSSVSSFNVAGTPLVTVPDGKYYINAYLKDSSSIDISGASKRSGVRLQLYGYNKTTAQQFQFTRQSDGSYVITNVNSGKALDVSGAAPGNSAVVQQYDVNGTAAQRWFIRDASPGYYLQSALGNWVLDLAGGATSNGTVAALYQPNRTNEQRFLLASTDAAVPTGVTVRLVSALNGRLVMDVRNGSTANAAALQLYAWNESGAQLFRFTECGNGVYTIANVASGRLVEIAGGALGNNGTIQQYGANGTQAQRWLVRKIGTRYTLLNSRSNAAIDVPGANAANSVRLQSYAGNGTSAQQWSIERFTTMRERLNELAAAHRGDLADGVYTFVTANNTAKALDVSGASHADAANVQLYQTNGTKAQRWKVTHDALGYVTLTSVESGKVLDVSGGSTANGANVQQYASNGTWAQRWVAVRNGDGSLTFRSGLNDGKVLDVSGGSTANGANVQLYDANGTKAQRWWTR